MNGNNNHPNAIGVKEIARIAKVSLATVDRVLHNRTGVSEATRARIQQIIEQLDYKPNIMARRLASGKVFRFAALIPEVSEETGYWAAPLNGINRAEAELSQYGITIERHLFDLNDRKSFIAKANLILEQQIDGIVIGPSFVEESTHFTNKCKERNIPYVFIDSDIPAQASLSYIGPELFKSGYLAGSLIGMLTNGHGKVLIVNIAKEVDNRHQIVRKGEGFKRYFKDNGSGADIIEANIHQTDYAAIENRLAETFAANPEINAVFVTNSRVFSVAGFLAKKERKDVVLIGYDYIEENIHFLKNGFINFLICQKPEQQGYRGVMALYRHLVLKIPVADIDYMPIDIITNVNYEFYEN